MRLFGKFRSKPVARRETRGALIFAVLAILANNALLPSLHFAAGGPAMTQMAPAHHHHDAGQSGQGGAGHSGADHQICHFCRLVGTALPPPPDTLLAGRPVASTEVSFASADQVKPAEHFATGHPARAPPRGT